MAVITLDKSDELYLQKCVSDAKAETVAFGIIIGQQIKAEEYIVVHLAKNQEDIDASWPMEKPSSDSITENTPKVVLNFADINTQFLANQWLSATRMIPGSFTVLGVFVGAKDEDILESLTFEMTRRVLNEIHNILMQSKLYSIDEGDRECIFLAYSLEAQRSVCMSYSRFDSDTALKPIQCNITNQPFQWHTFSCYYELNEVFPILQLTNKINIEQQFFDTVKAVRYTLETSEIYIQNESVNDEISVETYLKKLQTGNIANAKARSRELHATIYLPVNWSGPDKPNAIRVRLFGGTIRFLGGISSRVYCSPYSMLKDVKRYIRCDIIRSLVARIQVYCDGLTETKISNEALIISHPPRRVYFNLFSNSKLSPIQFSEYIFRNETTTMAVTQVQQTLDFDLKKEDIIDDLEALPADEAYSDFSTKIQSQRFLPTISNTTRNLTRSMYTLGIVVSLIVLLLSVSLNYMLAL